ncbi:MoaD family protein [Candidatus Thorarchaeota archaeon]|nr:MAG: MoaD family protein [Candidatus Thorarchaeota archaeon]
MPTVTVKFFATIRQITGDKSIEMEAETVREVLDSLIQKYGPVFSKKLMDSKMEKLKQFFSCMVNGRRIELLDGYETTLEEGDSIALFPPIGGG